MSARDDDVYRCPVCGPWCHYARPCTTCHNQTPTQETR